MNLNTAYKAEYKRIEKWECKICFTATKAIENDIGLHYIALLPVWTFIVFKTFYTYNFCSQPA